MFTSKTKSADMNLIRKALLGPMTDPTKLPIRYCIGGETYHGIPAEWNPKSTRRIIDANIIERDYSAKIPGTGLTIRVECFEYKDFPVYEWTAYLDNDGTENSPMVTDFTVIDYALPAGKETYLYHNNGDYAQRQCLETTELCLDNGELFTQTPMAGKSTAGAWPYYRIKTDDMCYNVVIGWGGTWTSKIQRTEEGIHVEARQTYINFYLKPGETVRTPRLLVMALEGGCDRAINMWRRYYFAHMLPRSKGAKIPPKYVFLDRAHGCEHQAATEENQCKAIKTYIERGEKIDIFWIDAGWYPCSNADGAQTWGWTGQWYPEASRFPNGLAPIGKMCEENGAEFLLWFEPERNVQEFWEKAGYNPDYIIQGGFFDFGNPEAREWMTKHVDKLIKDSHIHIYRQDFNIGPEGIWAAQEAETPDRRGITENLHLQGLLQYWDDLLIDNPDLWYDNCASGGMRNDYETMRRGVSLHTTDYGYGEHPVKQTFQKTWFEWIPYFRSMGHSWDDEDGNYFVPGKPPVHGYTNYAAHCSFGPSTTFGNETAHDSSDEEFAIASHFRKICTPAMEYTLDTDFFTLTPVRKSNEDYFVIQFNREDEDEGLIQVIRNTRCEEESVTVHPITFNPEKTYVFDAPETGETFEVSGAEINEKGLTFSVPKRSGRFWYYHAVQA